MDSELAHWFLETEEDTKGFREAPSVFRIQEVAGWPEAGVTLATFQQVH